MDLIKNILKLRFCLYRKDRRLSASFRELTGRMNVHHAFNPSFYCDDAVKIFAFRAVPRGRDDDDLVSYVAVEDRTGRTVVNITDTYCRELGEKQLIDPKVAKIRDAFYVTFNSGLVAGGNSIYIMKVFPAIEAPRRVVYKNRQEQERNWAFFSVADHIYALYWINPLVILKVKDPDAEAWEMEDYYRGSLRHDMSADLTLGTQTCEHDGHHYFIAHKKIILKKKKLYVGKCCALDFEHRKITPGKHWLAHSWVSLLGSRIKTNRNLFSCTYFSGIQGTGNTLTLGYGMNDRAPGFSTHSLRDLVETAPPPLVTIVLLNYRRPQNIPVILRAIRTQTIKAEVFLWNNGEDDVHAPGIDRYERSGRNEGCMVRWKMAAKAATPYVMCLDDDICFSRNDVLENMIACLEKQDHPSRIIGVTGSVFRNDPKYTDRTDVTCRIYEDERGGTCVGGHVSAAGGEPVDLVKGRVMMFRKHLLDGIDLPDEREDDIYINALFAGKARRFHRVPAILNDAFHNLPVYNTGSMHDPNHFQSRDRALKAYYGTQADTFATRKVS